MRSFALSLFLCLALFTSWSSADVVTIVDTTSGTANNNGSIGVGEYVGFSSGINSGFGDVAGLGSRLYVDSSIAGGLNFGFAKGAGNFQVNHALVIYIDSVAGGFSSTSSLTDTGDRGRRAVSGYDGTNRATLSFATGFEADYAITLEPGYAGLWTLKTGTYNAPLSANQSNNSSQWELNLTLANIGLVPGGSFKYIATYLDIDSAYRSNEFHGVASFGSNPGWSSVSLTSYNTFVSAVPEISPALSIPFAVVLVAGSITGWRRWKAQPAS